MSRTKKHAVVTIVATFEGDYIPFEQVEDYLTQWIDSGLEDRDDLRDWHILPIMITESLPDEDAEDEAA